MTLRHKVSTYEKTIVKVRNLKFTENTVAGTCGLIFSNSGHWFLDDWFPCREAFHKYSFCAEHMLFLHRLGKGKNVASFIYKVENILKRPSHIQFRPTQHKKVLWLEFPDTWWTEDMMRRSLFTILLRCGQNYLLKDNFQEALWSYCYARDTKPAIQRFLRGYTRTNYKHANRVGWWNQFHAASEEKLEKLLVYG